MRNTVHYEWDYEVIDTENEDVLNHWHEDNLSDFYRPLEKNERLVLVRNEGNEIEGLTDRLWAYVKDGKLAEYFSNAEDQTTDYKVPKAFHIELAKYLNK